MAVRDGTKAGEGWAYYRPYRRLTARPPTQLQVDRPVHLHAGHADGHHRRVHRADRTARHLPGYRTRSAPAGEHLLPAVDDPGLPGDHQCACLLYTSDAADE